MIEYADYSFYAKTYKGSLSVDLFNSLIPKASREIDKVVNRELQEEDIDNKVKFVACELVDFLSKSESSSGGVASISIDGVSKAFKSDAEVKQGVRNITNGLPHELTRFL